MTTETSKTQPVCQCCGMPLDEESVSKENREYCQWCFLNGRFHFETKDQLIDFFLMHIPNPDSKPDAERRKEFDAQLSQLKHWQ